MSPASLGQWDILRQAGTQVEAIQIIIAGSGIVSPPFENAHLDAARRLRRSIYVR